MEQNDPYNENVGQYASILTNTLKEELEKYNNDEINMKVDCEAEEEEKREKKRKNKIRKREEYNKSKQR